MSELQPPNAPQPPAAGPQRPQPPAAGPQRPQPPAQAVQPLIAPPPAAKDPMADVDPQMAEMLRQAMAAPELALMLISKEECERSLAEFTKQAWHIIEPGTPLVWNWHLDVLCAYIQAFYKRTLRVPRLIMNVPPGSMKSVLLAVMAPAWVWTWDPSRRMIDITNEIGLATRDSMRMRAIITSDWYLERWGETAALAPDQREKALFANVATGFRQGLGISGNLTGKRGSDLNIDDPLDAAKAFSDPEVNSVNQTYDQAVSSRLNTPAEDGIALIMQRLRTNDLTGHLLAKKQDWVHIRIPMRYEKDHVGYDPVADLGPEFAHLADPRTEDGELMFPERFPEHVVAALEEDLGEYGTAGQLQQRPTPLGGGIIKKQYWTKWPDDRPLPPPLLLFASYDTAYTDRDHKGAAYSARTTWMVFQDDATERYCLLLLGAWWERVDWVGLRKHAKTHHSEYNLNLSLIERKASGISLIQQLRRLHVPVRGFDPGRNDKTARAYLAAPMFESGLVYYFADKLWAKTVIEHVAAFPQGAPPSADLTDTVTQAVLWTRRKGWLEMGDEDLPWDNDEEMSEEALEDQQAASGSPYG